MFQLHTRLIASALTVGALCAGLLVAPAAAAPTSVSFEDDAFGLPAHSAKGQGGVFAASAICDDTEDEATTVTVVVRQGARTLASRSGDAAWEPIRVPQGTYQVTTTAACGGPAVSQTDRVTVGRLKDSETVSRGEFRKIKKGQKLSKITKIIGGKPYRVDSRRGRSYYLMPTTTFLEFAVFEFKGSRLSKKVFNVDPSDVATNG